MEYVRKYAAVVPAVQLGLLRTLVVPFFDKRESVRVGGCGVAVERDGRMRSQYRLALVCGRPFGAVRTGHLRRIRGVEPQDGTRTKHGRKINAVAEFNRAALHLDVHCLRNSAKAHIAAGDDQRTRAGHFLHRTAVQFHGLVRGNLKFAQDASVGKGDGVLVVVGFIIADLHSASHRIDRHGKSIVAYDKLETVRDAADRQGATRTRIVHYETALAVSALQRTD